jgi:putative tricarboxylic transport membrane protein
MIIWPKASRLDAASGELRERPEELPVKRNDVIPAMVWMGLGIALAIGSYKLKLGSLHTPGPGLMPFLLGIALSLCSFPVLVRSLQMIMRRPKQRSESIWAGINFKKLILVVASLIGYAVVLEGFGYVVTAFLVLVILFKTVESQRWTTVLVLSVLTVISTYLLFVFILSVQLPSGFLRIG